MSAEKKISSKRLLWFKIITISLPFVFLLVFETLLRIFNYGTSYPLFIEDPEKKDYLVMNPEISEKYFSRAENATVGYFESFKQKKEAGTIRLFVLGASTAVGFPYMHNGSFHRMLQWQLQQQYPELTIKIINLSLTAVNSYTLLDFSNHLLDYDPDGVIIYAGHNEYYGALGVGATNRLANWPWLVRFTIDMKELRIVQLLFNLLQLENNANETTDLKENLMKRMVKSAEIPFGSVAYHQGISQYQSNLEKLIKKLKANEIPFVIGDLICNEKDQKPFTSLMEVATDSVYFKKKLKQADSLLESQNHAEAQQVLLALISQDSSMAEAHFLMGKTLFHQGYFEEARVYFQQAKEMDALRFRAPAAINEVITSLAEKHEIPLAMVDSTFRRHSPQAIIGEELILEHLHPNLTGYRLMAEAYLHALQKTNIIPAMASVNGKLDWQDYPLTVVDSLYGWYGTLILKEGWPFYEKFELDTTRRTLPEAIAGALVVKQITWDQAMEKLYQYYFQQEDFENALRVTSAVLLEYPENPQFYAKAGSLCLRIQDFSSGAAYFTQAFRLHQDTRYAYYAAICYSRLKDWQRAGDILELMLRQNPDDVKSAAMLKTIRETAVLTEKINQDQQDITLMTQLARNFFLLGLKTDARKITTRILKTNPDNELAREIMEKLDKAEQS